MRTALKFMEGTKKKQNKTKRIPYNYNKPNFITRGMVRDPQCTSMSTDWAHISLHLCVFLCVLQGDGLTFERELYEERRFLWVISYTNEQ